MTTIVQTTFVIFSNSNFAKYIEKCENDKNAIIDTLNFIVNKVEKNINKKTFNFEKCYEDDDQMNNEKLLKDFMNELKIENENDIPIIINTTKKPMSEKLEKKYKQYLKNKEQSDFDSQDSDQMNDDDSDIESDKKTITINNNNNNNINSNNKIIIINELNITLPKKSHKKIIKTNQTPMEIKFNNIKDLLKKYDELKKPTMIKINNLKKNLDDNLLEQTYDQIIKLINNYENEKKIDIYFEKVKLIKKNRGANTITNID